MKACSQLVLISSSLLNKDWMDEWSSVESSKWLLWLAYKQWHLEKASENLGVAHQTPKAMTDLQKFYYEFVYKDTWKLGQTDKESPANIP